MPKLSIVAPIANISDCVFYWLSRAPLAMRATSSGASNPENDETSLSIDFIKLVYSLGQEKTLTIFTIPYSFTNIFFGLISPTWL